jgi:hypothetical protein
MTTSTAPGLADSWVTLLGLAGLGSSVGAAAFEEGDAAPAVVMAASARLTCLARSRPGPGCREALRAYPGLVAWMRAERRPGSVSWVVVIWMLVNPLARSRLR